MRKFIAIALSVVFSGNAMAAELDTCATDLVKIPVNTAGTDQEKIDACVVWLYGKVKAGSNGKLIGKFAPGFDLIKWESGREWIYGHCFVYKGDALFTLNSVSPTSSKPGVVMNKACAAQNPVWIMLYPGEKLAHE